MMQTTFISPEIECDGCATSIRKALQGSPGVESVDVIVPAKTIRIGFDPQVTDPASLRELLNDVGFPTSPA